MSKEMTKKTHWRWIISLGLILLTIAFFAIAKTSPTAKVIAAPHASLLEIKGPIGPAIQDFIERGLVKAKDSKAQVVILKIDTPGGLSQSMRGIIKAILASSIPVISYVAPSGAHAASAGTYILYASHIAAMAPGTNLGAATPVSIGNPAKQDNDNKNKSDKDKKSEKKPSASELKAINDAKAYIKSLAELRGRNVAWAEQAVTSAESISAKEALKKGVIDYMANTIQQLLAKADGRKVLLQSEQKIIHSKDLSVRQIQPDWRNRFLAVITNPSVAYILLMIGFYGLFFEFANPGSIVPGVAGAIALLLALYAFQLLPIDYAGLGLIILGLVLITAEAFVPSFGALGIGGAISFLAGSILLLKNGAMGYSLPIQLIIAVTVVTVIFFVLVLQLAIRSRRKPVVSGRRAMVGKRASVSLENDEAWVMVNGERWQVTADIPLKNGEQVEVLAMEGLTLKVKSVAEES